MIKLLSIKPLSIKQLSRGLRSATLGATLVAVVSVACSKQLKDYTQLTMDVTVPEGVSDVDGEAFAITEGILTTRLAGLGIDTAEIEAVDDNQLLVRLPRSADIVSAEAVLTNPGLLSLRNQKPDTEADLAAGIETLQRLLVEQENLVQTEKPDEAEALQAEIDKTRGEILALFETSTLTGDYLLDARALPMEDNTWGVNIQFDEEGTQLFAEQTKLMAGTGRTIGLFLDDVLLSTPEVSVNFAEKGIDSGSAVISGSFTAEAAKDLEIQLKSGALPVILEVVEITSNADEVDEAGATSVSEPEANEREAVPKATSSEASESEDAEKTTAEEK